MIIKMHAMQHLQKLYSEATPVVVEGGPKFFCSILGCKEESLKAAS